jgi:hypothetical protein
LNNDDALGDRADVHVTIIDVRPILAFGTSAAGESRHAPFERDLSERATRLLE